MEVIYIRKRPLFTRGLYSDRLANVLFVSRCGPEASYPTGWPGGNQFLIKERKALKRVISGTQKKSASHLTR